MPTADAGRAPRERDPRLGALRVVAAAARFHRSGERRADRRGGRPRDRDVPRPGVADAGKGRVTCHPLVRRAHPPAGVAPSGATAAPGQTGGSSPCALRVSQRVPAAVRHASRRRRLPSPLHPPTRPRPRRARSGRRAGHRRPPAARSPSRGRATAGSGRSSARRPGRGRRPRRPCRRRRHRARARGGMALGAGQRDARLGGWAGAPRHHLALRTVRDGVCHEHGQALPVEHLLRDLGALGRCSRRHDQQHHGGAQHMVSGADHWRSVLPRPTVGRVRRPRWSPMPPQDTPHRPSSCGRDPRDRRDHDTRATPPRGATTTARGRSGEQLAQEREPVDRDRRPARPPAAARRTPPWRSSRSPP